LCNCHQARKREYRRCRRGQTNCLEECH
jgi:hypothetical protein